MGSITEGETCSAFRGKCCTVKQGVLKATMSVKHLPYFLQPFSLDHLQDLFMAHGCVGVFLQNLKEHNKMSKNVTAYFANFKTFYCLNDESKQTQHVLFRSTQYFIFTSKC